VRRGYINSLLKGRPGLFGLVQKHEYVPMQARHRQGSVWYRETLGHAQAFSLSHRYQNSKRCRNALNGLRTSKQNPSSFLNPTVLFSLVFYVYVRFLRCLRYQLVFSLGPPFPIPHLSPKLWSTPGRIRLISPLTMSSGPWSSVLLWHPRFQVLLIAIWKSMPLGP
jgi:hypothetical protein